MDSHNLIIIVLAVALLTPTAAGNGPMIQSLSDPPADMEMHLVDLPPGVSVLDHDASNVYSDVSGVSCSGHWGDAPPAMQTTVSGPGGSGQGTTDALLAPATSVLQDTDADESLAYYTPSGSTTGTNPAAGWFASWVAGYLLGKVADEVFNIENNPPHIPGEHPWYVICDVTAEYLATCDSGSLGSLSLDRECIMQYLDKGGDDVHPSDPCHPEASGAPWCDTRTKYADIPPSSCKYGLVNGGASCDSSATISVASYLALEGVWSMNDEVPVEAEVCATEDVLSVVNRPAADEYNLEHLLVDTGIGANSRGYVGQDACDTGAVTWDELRFYRETTCGQGGSTSGGYWDYSWDPEDGDASATVFCGADMPDCEDVAIASSRLDFPMRFAMPSILGTVC